MNVNTFFLTPGTNQIGAGVSGTATPETVIDNLLIKFESGLIAVDDKAKMHLEDGVMRKYFET